MTTLVATSVVRGTHQGESHGGVYLVDLAQRRTAQCLDWNTTGIDWQGRGWDRGLRGIALDGERVYIAASDELFAYSPDFRALGSWRCPYLKHCHEIARHERRLFLTSTGYDSILGFDLDANRFSFGLHVMRKGDAFRGQPFDPNGDRGPAPVNNLHINNVFCTAQGMFVSGLRTEALLCFNGRHIAPWAELPAGVHNARPFRDGVLFNDTDADQVRFVGPRGQVSFAVPRYDARQLTHTDLGDARVARQAFARGLCELPDGLVAAGSSPSTITLHDVERAKSVLQVTISLDIRNAIHGLEVWPFG